MAEWRVTEDVWRFEAAAGEFLRADPAENTVPLVILATMRERGADAYGPARFGWWGEPVEGVFVQTGGWPLLLTAMPERAARELPELLQARPLKGVQGAEGLARAFTAAYGTPVREETRMRLYRLESLQDPDPLPNGAARVATAGDLDLIFEWGEAFHRDTPGAQTGSRELTADRIEYGGYVLWETGGRPVAMAGRTRVAEGMARVGPVYTPAEHRRQGYGAAATAAVSQVALDAGARTVVLFTDLANPTSNGIYQKIGYRPLSDRVMQAYL
jgi:predicted GNAT family acetyltransferase